MTKPTDIVVLNIAHISELDPPNFNELCVAGVTGTCSFMACVQGIIKE